MEKTGKLKAWYNKSELDRAVLYQLTKKKNKKPILKLLDTEQKFKMEEIEAVLLTEAGNFEQKVNLEGKRYSAYDLARLIVDWPCELKWSENRGLEVREGNYEDWNWFKETFLIPNKCQLDELFKLVNRKLLNIL